MLSVSNCTYNNDSYLAEKSNDAIEKIFDIAYADFKEAVVKEDISISSSISSWHATYWLPQKVEPLLDIKSLTFLEKILSESNDIFRYELASILIRIIKAKSFYKGEPYKGSKSGIKIVAYTHEM